MARTINTFNESNLHKVLKLHFAQKYNGQTEIPYKKWICDIMLDDGTIIEIQTSNLQALKEKALSSINEKRKFIIVHPIITEKKIEVYTKEEILISKRKSPKKQDLWNSLKDLTGIAPILLNRYITLILIEVKITEQRIQTEKKIQIKNKNCSWKKNWYKSGNKLSELGIEHTFYGKKTWLNLLPNLPNEFSSLELKKALIQQNFPKSAIKETNLILWLYSKMGIIKEIERREKRKYYKKII